MNKPTLAALAFIVVGCGQRPQPPDIVVLNGPVIEYDAINYSGSSGDQIAKSLVSSARAGKALPSGSGVIWYRMDSDSQEVLSLDCPFTLSRALTKLKSQFPVRKTVGTRLDLFLLRVLQNLPAQGGSFIICIYGDGFCEMTPPNALQEVAGRLARCKGLLKVIFIGAKAGSKEFLRNNLQAFVGRIRFCDYDDSLTRMSARVGGSR